MFRTISATPGITRIDLRQFNSRDSRSTCGAFVETSTTPFLIEGKLYDKGKKGTMPDVPRSASKTTGKKIG